jgi:hypothetical protein
MLTRVVHSHAYRQDSMDGERRKWARIYDAALLVDSGEPNCTSVEMGRSDTWLLSGVFIVE